MCLQNDDLTLTIKELKKQFDAVELEEPEPCNECDRFNNELFDIIPIEFFDELIEKITVDAQKKTCLQEEKAEDSISDNLVKIIKARCESKLHLSFSNVSQGLVWSDGEIDFAKEILQIIKENS